MDFTSKYRIGARIGKGYSGTVFDCMSLKDGKKFACKIISGRTSVQRNNNEIGILHNLKHKNINGIKEVFSKTGKTMPTNHVISELAHGDLVDYSKKYKINEDVTKHFLRQILESAKYLHMNNICHSDFKLENVLYVDSLKKMHEDNHEIIPTTYKHNDKDIELKLIDFEFSKHTYKDGVRKQLNGRCGTISFMAPEMVRGQRYNELVDMWSIGVITYSLLFDTYPIIYTQIRVPDSFKIHYMENSKVNPAAIDFTKRLLVEDPNDRITAHEALQHEWLQA